MHYIAAQSEAAPPRCDLNHFSPVQPQQALGKQNVLQCRPSRCCLPQTPVTNAADRVRRGSVGTADAAHFSTAARVMELTSYRVHTRQLVAREEYRSEVGVSSPRCRKRACRKRRLSQKWRIIAAAPGAGCLRLSALVQPKLSCTAMQVYH